MLRNKIYTTAVMFVILFSISSASILVLLSGADAVACAFWRLTLSTALLSALSLRRIKQVLLSGLTKYTLLAGIALAFHFIFWMQSLFLLPVAISVTIVVTYPLYSVIVDYIVFRERIRKQQLLGLVTGSIGAMLYVRPPIGNPYDLRGVLLAFLGALSITLYFAVGRYLRRSSGLMEYVIPTYSIASIITFAYAKLFSINLIYYSYTTYIYFLLLALIPMMGGHTLMNYLLKRMKVSTVTSIALGEPIGASILAYILLRQALSMYELLVMAIVLSSILLVIYSEASETT